MTPITWIFLNLLILCCLWTIVNGAHEEKYIGYELSSRTLLVPTGRRIVLFKDISYRKGRVTHFHAFFGGSSKFHFQIWRRVWSPQSIENYVLVIDRNITTELGNFTLNVTQEKILTEEGDRLGFLNDDTENTPVLASMVSYFETSTLFNGLTSSLDLPQVNDTVSFDGLVYPYIFSVGSTYIPDVHDQGILIGATGATGASGPLGSAGDQGLLGPPGATGPFGNPGSSGEPGTPGLRGDTGLTGPVGRQGEYGPRGENGTKGDTGPPGSQGPQGEQGIHGKNGSDGIGSTGATGFTGPLGPIGLNGEDGHTGPIGYTGHTGPFGEPGLKGDAGWFGATGPLGHTGPMGDSGFRGPPGPPGFYNGTWTVDIDMDCNNYNVYCHHTCTAQNGFPECRCKPGYILQEDDQTCHDINECLEDNGGCQMVCVDIEGSYKCQCGEGLKLSPNGHTCVDVLECDIDQGDCGSHQVCVEMYSSNMCVANEDAYNVILPDLESSKAGEDSELLTHNVVMGLIIWLGLLTLLIFLVLICYCLQHKKHTKEKRLYKRYAESLRGPIY